MELILLSAYCPDIKRQDLLRNLVNNLSEQGKDILLVSHSIVPEDIVKRCKFYFYDEENKFLPNDELKLWFMLNTSKGMVKSRDVYPISTSLIPVYRLILFGLGIAKHLKYKYVHYMEYDNEVKDISFIDNNTEILKQGYSSVAYKFTNGYGYEMIEGSYSAYNLDYFSFEDLEFDEDELISKYRRNYPFVERMTKTEFLDPKNPYYKPQTDIEQEGLISNLHYSGNATDWNYVCPVVEEDGSFFVLHHREPGHGPDNEEEVEVIVDNSYKRLATPRGHCRFIPTGKRFEDVSYIKAIRRGQVVFEYDLTKESERKRLLENNILDKK